jgi:hypothetical protein
MTDFTSGFRAGIEKAAEVAAAYMRLLLSQHPAVAKTNGLLAAEADGDLAEQIRSLLPEGAEGWWRLPDEETDDCEAFNGREWLVADERNGTVGEARYFSDDKGWWWAGFDPTDAVDRQCWPTHYRPLPPPPSKEG